SGRDGGGTLANHRWPPTPMGNARRSSGSTLVCESGRSHSRHADPGEPGSVSRAESLRQRECALAREPNQLTRGAASPHAPLPDPAGRGGGVSELDVAHADPPVTRAQG